MRATRAFYSTFREEYITPAEYRDVDWGDYRARMGRYALYEALYNNTAYRSIERWSGTYKNKYELYKHIRGIYNPAYRLVELIAAKTMGGMIDWENLKTGAIPVTQADDALIGALLQVMRWSKLGQMKTLYARQAAKLGDCGLWVVDDPDRRKVRVEVLHPAKIKAAEFDPVGNVTRASLEYAREWTDPTGQRQVVVYRMDVDKARFATFKDDQPYAWHTDARGRELVEWPNPYGFVPLVKSDFKDVGLRWAANCFHAAVNKINEVNDAASILDDGIRKAADPPWYGSGINADDDLTFSGELDDGTSTTEPSAVRDDTSIIGGPKDSDLKSLAPQIDVAGIATNIQNLLQELERDMPELAMHRLRDLGGGMSGIAIRNMFTDASGRLIEAMGNLDDGLIRALQMGVSIGGFRGYDGFTGFDLNSYDRGDLDFYIKERPLFEDGFTPEQRVQIMTSLPQNPAAARFILVNELEVAEDDANAIVAGQVNLPAQQPGDVVTLPGQTAPQLPAGQGSPQNGNGTAPDDDVRAEVQRILQSIGEAA